jgi:hypothetical protein
MAWGGPHLLWTIVHTYYRDWSRAFTPLGVNSMYRVTATVAYELACAMVMAAALRQRDSTFISSVVQVLRAAPILLPFWLVSDVESAWRLFSWWSGIFSGLPTEVQLYVSLAHAASELLLALAGTAALGVLYPVILEERRGPFEAVSRTWKLMTGVHLKVLGLYLIYVTTAAVLALLFVLIIDVSAGTTNETLIRGLAAVVVSKIGETWWCVATVASYLELREIKEGSPLLQTVQAFA